MSETRTTPPYRYLSRESDPRVLAQVLETLADYGPLPLDQISHVLRERSFSFNKDKADTIRREFEFLGWIKTGIKTWELTNSAHDLAASSPSRKVDCFTRELVQTYERKATGVISQLLRTMWEINAVEQGAVIIPQPALSDLSIEIEDLKAWLIQELQRWNVSLEKKCRNLFLSMFQKRLITLSANP